MSRATHTVAVVLGAASLLLVLAPSTSSGEPGPGAEEVGARTAGVVGDEVPDRDVPVHRLAGEDRFATGAAIADSSHGDRGDEERAEAAVLARGDAFADALAGVPLAHHLDAPLLLTRPTDLPDVTRDALERLVAAGGTVHVLGGLAAVGEEVEDGLRAAGWRVERHAGETRYGTAAAIAAALPDGDLAYVASGVEPADALAAAPVAARRGAPVLLTDPSRLPEDTAAALADVDRVVLVGGTAAVSGTVADDLRARHEVVRVAGEDRFATAVAVARQAPGPPTAVSIASGRSWPDALAGAAHAAATSSTLLLSDTDRLTWPTADEVARLAGLPVTIYGGRSAVSPVVDQDVRLARASDPDAPVPTGLVPGRRLDSGSDLRVSFSRALGSADVVAEPAADAGPRSDGTDVVVPLPSSDGTDLVVTVRGQVSDADGRTRHFREPVVVAPPAASTASPEGFRVAVGTGPVVGTGGPVVTWTAEVEPATGRRLDQVLPVLSATLGETERGWTAGGRRRLRRVDDPAAADVRVVLATPDTVDRHCARHGLDTAGTFSCWDGQRAMLNLTRWDHGAAAFDDLATYRTYQVNHEVGHGLGHGHQDCPRPDAPAPVMMQQTRTVGACRPNGWPSP